MEGHVSVPIYAADYVFRPPDNGKPYPGSGHAYRPLCVARNVHTHQDLVVYRGLTGPDRGLCYACTLSDWGQKFALAAPREPAEVAPLEAAGGTVL